MRADGRDHTAGRSLAKVRTHGTEGRKEVRPDDVVFDFAGLHTPDLSDLSLVLTARLQNAAGERVWARALPQTTWMVLGALGLDHLFHRYPTPDVFD